MRSAFAAALCAGVAMVGASVHGLLGVDAELERSVLAAQHQSIDYHSVRAITPPQRDWDCSEPDSEPRYNQRV